MSSPTRPPESDLANFHASLAKAADRPIFIYDKIQYKVHGEGRSKEDYLSQYFSRARDAKTLKDLTAALQEGVSSLRGVGIYKNIVVHVDDLPADLQDKFKNHCSVRVEVTEKKWYTASIGGYVTDDLPEFKMEGALRNLGGRGETVFGRLSTTTDCLKSFTFTLGLMKPLHFPSGRNAVFNVMVHNSIYDTLASSNYTQKVTGGSIRLDMMPHSLSYEAAIRDTTLGPEPSPELQQDKGQSIKSGIRYSFSRDYRDNVTFPTRGQAYQFSSELAGLGGDVNFVKNEFSYNFNFPLHKMGIAFNYILKGGMVAPLAAFNRNLNNTNTDNTNTNNNNNNNNNIMNPYHVRVCDRFFLGGLGTALSLRGFKPRGIDTGNEREAHGGELYYTTAAHLTFPLPFISHINFIRGHLFANAGNLVHVKQGEYNKAAEELKDKARSVLGGGVIFTTPIGGRFEFNYCYPLRVRFAGDKVAKGYQFGVSFTI